MWIVLKVTKLTLNKEKCYKQEEIFKAMSQVEVFCLKLSSLWTNKTIPICSGLTNIFFLLTLCKIKTLLSKNACSHGFQGGQLAKLARWTVPNDSWEFWLSQGTSQFPKGVSSSRSLMCLKDWRCLLAINSYQEIQLVLTVLEKWKALQMSHGIQFIVPSRKTN